jgi:Fe-S-cluster-containing hydrogenase component 2
VEVQVSLEENGSLSMEELVNTSGYPSKERFLLGPVAVIECVQEVPCDPCELSCPFGPIRVGKPITNLPVLIEEDCVGCGRCLPFCPGLAIFLVDKTYSDELSTISFPYEFLPLPKKGQEVLAVDREGQPVCSAEVVRVSNPKSNDRTAVLTIAVPKDMADRVRGIKKGQRDA